MHFNDIKSAIKENPSEILDAIYKLEANGHIRFTFKSEKIRADCRVTITPAGVDAYNEDYYRKEQIKYWIRAAGLTGIGAALTFGIKKFLQ